MSITSENLVNWIYLERVDYSKGLSYQMEIHKRVSLGKYKGFLLLVEHNPVVTIGRFGDESNILISKEDMKRRGVEIWRIERGGDVTFHGPGQLVGYPIINLRDFKLGVKSYIHLLEETLIGVIDRFGIRGERIKDHTGVWIGKEKIAAIGVYVKNGITMHGFALNVNTDLKYFSFIIPCGISNMGVTSMKEILGMEIPLEKVAVAFAEEFGERFQTNMILATEDAEITGFFSASPCSL
ncbi:MAG: octanoyltransferase [Candidatus Dadabacteria bacterium]